MSSEPVIRLEGIGKCYHLYNRPHDRLLQMLHRGRRQYYRELWALKDISFEVGQGEVVGVVGSNGAGKSTLLQVICGTLSPTEGALSVRGRVAALLELGAGFNPEFSGQENIYLTAMVMGLSRAEIQARYDEIVEFSGLGDFIQQPVKTYSSGMYVRLAFSVATSVDPDILIVDEALSVGDGAFSRKSFDRIMSLMKSGKTILFCSHSLYQIEAICNRALWLKHGRLMKIGDPAEVVVAYSEFLNGNILEAGRPGDENRQEVKKPVSRVPAGTAALLDVTVSVDGVAGDKLQVRSRASGLTVCVRFGSDPNLPSPSVAVGFTLPEGQAVASSSTFMDGITIERDECGIGQITIEYPNLPFLKGQYLVFVYLMCENGVHVYDHVHPAALVNVTQSTLEQGIVSIEHVWDRGS